MMRPGYGDWRELRRAHMECYHKDIAVNSEAALLPHTSYWGETEDIRSICPLAPNGVIYCMSANSDHVERLSIRNDPSVGLVPLSEDAGDIRALTFGPHDTVLIFNGVNHWDSFVPERQVRLLPRPHGQADLAGCWLRRFWPGRYL